MPGGHFGSPKCRRRIDSSMWGRRWNPRRAQNRPNNLPKWPTWAATSDNNKLVNLLGARFGFGHVGPSWPNIVTNEPPKWAYMIRITPPEKLQMGTRCPRKGTQMTPPNTSNTTHTSWGLNASQTVSRIQCFIDIVPKYWPN